MEKDIASILIIAISIIKDSVYKFLLTVNKDYMYYKIDRILLIWSLNLFGPCWLNLCNMKEIRNKLLYDIHVHVNLASTPTNVILCVILHDCYFQ